MHLDFGRKCVSRRSVRATVSRFSSKRRVLLSSYQGPAAKPLCFTPAIGMEKGGRRISGRFEGD